MIRSRPKSVFVILALAVWLAMALLVGASGRLEDLRPQTHQLILIALTVATLATVWFVPQLRRWAIQVDVRWLVGLHLTRFLGAYFLVLYKRGELPYAFAVPGGWGDIGVASLAALVLVLGPPDGRRRRVYLVWNVLGLADILFVVATAARLALASAESMDALVRLPLSLLPTYLVPLIIASHIVILVRLVRTRGAETFIR